MNIIIIAAIARNNAIGYRNKLLYWLPDDLKRFKRLTTGHTIIMGRKTFESFPKGALPNRRNVVLSYQNNLSLHGAEVYSSLESALKSCAHDEDVYIIGGESIYKAALPWANRLCLTEIADTPQCADAYFPSFERSEWKEVSCEKHAKDERHAFDFSFVDYKRI